MGAACCIAAKDKELPDSAGVNSLHSNVGCSPTWSFHWENRSRVAGEVNDSSYPVLHGLRRDVSLEVKRPLGSDRGDLSGGVSPQESFGTPISQKSPVPVGMCANLMTQPSVPSLGRNNPVEVMSLTESPGGPDLSAAKFSYSVHSPVASSLSSHGHPLHPNSTPSRRARHSPGHQLLRQISDSRILGLKSPNNYSLSEGRSSFVLSTNSHDLAMGSHGGSSDCWSMRTFSELVATSQRERWSFDSEQLGFGKVAGGSSWFSCSPASDLQFCAACSKFLSERSSWCSGEVPVVAVLVCGHAYHAECLETMTLEVDRFDPPCPMCMGGDKHVSKKSKRALRAEVEMKAKFHKISRNRVIDSSVDSDSDDFCCEKNALLDGSMSKMEPSSSAARSSIKPFLRRHFSFRSKWSRSLSEKDSAMKKGFWTRYLKD
uniref:RING-type domain-containing protein n=2 Tax=Rhizophora mucronata TaxID=61149 RepID=A0A2P2KEZ8_RHIMU